MQLVLTPVLGIPHIRPGDDLGGILLDALLESDITLIDGDILLITQKIVSKAEGRLVDLASVKPSLEASKLAVKVQKDPRLVELILQESASVVRIRPGLIIVEHRLGFICANAGIDQSNVQPGDVTGKERVLLLPSDPDLSAMRLRKQLEGDYEAQIGVLIVDSHGRPWRLGTNGVVIGLSGVPGLVDLRGSADLFGYQLRVTEVGAADELAAAASLVMGQAAEGRPVVHARGFPYPLREGTTKEIIRPKDDDLFR